MRPLFILIFAAVAAGLTATSCAADPGDAVAPLPPGSATVKTVVDGDTIWYRHQKIRIADINAPEVSEPQCDAELDLGEKASERLIALLNKLLISVIRTIKIMGLLLL